MPELGGPGGPWPPQYLADQLTLFQPGRADYPHLLQLAPPMFLPSSIIEKYSLYLIHNCSLPSLGQLSLQWPHFLYFPLAFNSVAHQYLPEDSCSIHLS